MKKFKKVCLVGAVVTCICCFAGGVFAGQYGTSENRDYYHSKEYEDSHVGLIHFKGTDVVYDEKTGEVSFKISQWFDGTPAVSDVTFYIDRNTFIPEEYMGVSSDEVMNNFISGKFPWISVYITTEDGERMNSVAPGESIRIHVSRVTDISQYVALYPSAEEKERNRRLSERGIMVGDPDGGFYPYRVLTRAEMAKIAVTMSAPAFRAGSAETVGGFADVSPEHWAHDYIAYAAQKGILQGYPDGSFRPEEKLTYAEAIKILVEMLGYGAVAQEQGGYPQGYLQTAEKLSLTKDLTVMADEAILRQEVAVLADRGLNTPLMKMLEDNTAVVCDGSSPDYPLETLNLLNFKEFEK